MSNALYEIVMLPNGDVVLQRTDEQEAPLVTISFSKDAKAMLNEHRITVAKAMIDAGIDAVDDLSRSTPEDEFLYSEGEEHTLH